MGLPSKPNAADPARGLDLVGRYLPLVVGDGDRHPSTELGLIAHKAPHAERHPHPANEGLVHSLARLAFHHTARTERPNGRASGLMSDVAVGNFVIVAGPT